MQASDASGQTVEEQTRRGCGTYVRRRPELGVLHRVLREHLESFLAEARARGDGSGLPRFVERELREFLSCGMLARGFARFQCDECKHEILVAFSCKGRGFCASCCGRRMAALAAHLVDDVLGGLPVRQWVLTLPHRLRYAMAFDHKLCRAVLGAFIRALLRFERRSARRRGIPGGIGGAVTAIQRFGSAINLNVHFHTLALQGVFVAEPDGSRRFVPSPAPTDVEVERLLASVRRRIVRLARRRGIELEQPTDEVHPTDELALESPVLAEISGASVLGRVVTGPRAGAPVQRIGCNPVAPPVTSSAPRQAHIGGFDLHANVAVPAGDHARLEHLARYVLRPPLAQDALEVTPEGNIVLKIRRPWHDGTQAIRFTPSELIEKLAVLVPRPRVNLLIYHGVLAPGARLRRQALAGSPLCELEPSVAPMVTIDPPPANPELLLAEVATAPGVDSFIESSSTEPSQASPSASLGGPGSASTHSQIGCVDLDGSIFSSAQAESGGKPDEQAVPPPTPRDRSRTRPPYYSWAQLMRRTFEIDVLSCPGCGGRLRFLATIDDPAVIKKILAHLGMPTEPPEARPARSPPRLSADLPLDVETLDD